MVYLFDTNVISALRNPAKIDEGVAASLQALPLETAYVSAITLMELEIGVLGMERRDPRQGASLRRWLLSFRAEIKADRIIAVSEGIGVTCAAIQVPNRRPLADALIAATALVHGLTLVTRNVKDFRKIDGLRLLDPWA
ncbi:type II toxin-antitoxin system VapC family toxin [Jiella sp. MQZ13P-4]|uniref:Ribonuclease VapC n=1 Tax=Jiella sonneratiae TaxID=2816856 RepID=A0ABS3J3Y0_9HYPH|nr:type II toxin-antitoxin system VapC family toxin [Jiella sonneratiae]